MSNSKQFVFFQYRGKGSERIPELHSNRIGSWSIVREDGTIQNFVEIDRDIIIKSRSGPKLCKIGDWIILGPDGWYFNDAKYLPDYVK